MLSEEISIYEAVTNPLGFFVLVVLLVEAIFGITAVKFKDQRTLIVIAMIALIFLLVGIVATLAYYKPEALRGNRYVEDAEIKKIRENFREVEQLAKRVVGNWSFVCKFQKEGQQEPVETRGLCTIIKGKYGLSMHGNCQDAEGNPTTRFKVKQVFINEDGLTYIYEVPKTLGQKILGVGQVGFVRHESESLVSKMVGNWAVLGSELSGTAEFKREK